MAVATNDSYTAASGGAIQAGLLNLPVWAPAAGQFAQASTALPVTIDPCPADNCVYTGTQGFSAVWTTWNGGAFAPLLGSLGSLILFGGGHNAYDGNAVLRFDISSRAWSRLIEPSAYDEGDVNGNGAYPDGKPYPCHTNMGCDYLPPDAGGGTLGSYVFMSHGQTGVAITNNVLYRFDLSTLSWSSWVMPTDIGRFPCLAYDSNRKGLWCFSNNFYDENMPSASSRVLFFLDVENETQTSVGINTGGGLLDVETYIPSMEYHPGKDCLVFPRNGSALDISCIDLTGCVVGTTSWVPQFLVTQSGTKCSSLWSGSDGSFTGGNAYLNYAACERLAYCSQDGKFWAIGMDEGSVCKLYSLTVPSDLDSGTWTWASETLTAKASETVALRNTSIATTQDKHMYGRFRYVPGLKGFIFSDDENLHAQVARPAAFT